MSLILKFWNKTAHYFLRKGMRNIVRKKKLINIHDALSIGILFELKDESVYFAIQKYLKSFQDKKVKVKVLGFASDKMILAHILPVLSFDFFTEKQLNWFNIPKAICVHDFIENDFDICINLGSDSAFSLKYIAGLSKARLKVGAYNREMEEAKYKELAGIYDIMLMSDENHDQAAFLNTIHEYLTILNPKKDV